MNRPSVPARTAPAFALLASLVLAGCDPRPDAGRSRTECVDSAGKFAAEDYVCQFCVDQDPFVTDEMCKAYRGGPGSKDNAAAEAYCADPAHQNERSCEQVLYCKGGPRKLSCEEMGLMTDVVLAILLTATQGAPPAVEAAERVDDDGTIVSSAILDGLTEFPLSGEEAQPVGLTGGPDGNLWVTVPNFDEIHRITPAGAVSRLSLKFNQANGFPFSITSGPDGNLWFTLTSSQRIGQVTPSGSFLSFFHSAGRPVSITPGPDGNLWYTAVQEHAAGQIGRITPGFVITTFFLPELTPPGPKSPHGIVAGPDGNLWFTEAAVGKIGRITPTGTITEFALPDPEAIPTGIAAGPDGNLWFTELGAAAIGRITPAGGVTEFPLPDAGAQPFSIAAGPDGNLWFTEFAANNVGRITPSGAVTEFTLPTANAGALVIGEGPGGELWLTESRAGRVAKVTTQGLVLETVLPEFTAGPGDIERGPDGNLWFVAGRRSTIVRMTPQGAATHFSIPGLTGPTGMVAITLGSDGNLWFTDSSQPPRIGRITPAGEATMFLAPDAPPGSFFPVTPTDITSGPDGNLYFTDYQGTRIGRVATNGTMTLIPIVPEDLDSSVLPAGITTGPDGNLWFADRGNGAIFRMTPGGVFTPFRLDADNSATAITTGPDGALWFTASNTVGRITTAGVVTDEFTVPGFAFANLTGITTGPDGALWVTSQTTNRLLRVETSGEMEEFPLAAGAQPVAIVVGPDDALWFTEPGVNKIGRLDPAEAAPPEPPAGDWLTAEELKGFRAKVRVTGGAGPFPGTKVDDCIEDTLCVSGALKGRPELFVRVVGPKPNGKLWPTLVKFSTSQNEVWIEQLSTGIVRYYKLLAADPGGTILNLAGLADREAFSPTESGADRRYAERSIVAAWRGVHGVTEETPPTPPEGPWLTSTELTDFQVKVRVGGSLAGSKVEDCIEDTLCISGALKGRPEVFVRVVGPKPNGKLWPTLVKFSTSRNEVWIEQLSTGVLRYYDLPAAAPGAEILDLAGLADKQGFAP